MGLVRYYRQFIKNFSKIGHPITAWQKKGKMFEWMPIFAVSFDKLKQLLKNALVLRVVDLDKYFITYTNTYKEKLGGVLMQDEQVVYYESWKFNEHEKNYVTHDLELATIIHALKMWRHYLLGRIFTLMTNHGGLKYLF